MAVTEDQTGYLNTLKWTWTCTSAGAYSEASTYRYNGAAVEFVTIPAGGGDAPTAAYDVTILDGDGLDILMGNGADRSATATEYKKASDGLGFVKSSTLTLTIANAGDIKKGTVYLKLMDVDKP